MSKPPSEEQKLNPTPAPYQVLRDVLLHKLAASPQLSMRSIAQRLDVSHTYLSLVIRGKKNISAKRALHYIQILGGNTEDAQSLAIQNPSEFEILQLDRFRTLSQWYHIAILDLTQLRGFRSDPNWIAEKLGITLTQTKSALERLERLGLLTNENGRLKKTHSSLAIPTTYSDGAIRSFHEQMIGKALEALQSPSREDFKKRDITGVTIPVNPARLEAARTKIMKFRRSLMKFLSSGECTELYQLNVQLFNLTKKGKL
jgi:transcriptional regulator with XRE-family HTH domain